MDKNEIKTQMKKEIMLEYARKLGSIIRDSDEIKRMNAAEQAYNECRPLQELVTEYCVNERAASENKDEEIGVTISRRMEELYAEIEQNEIYKEYMDSQYAVRDLMNTVNDEIQYAILGKRSCSPDMCASCKGCSGAPAEEKNEEN